MIQIEEPIYLGLLPTEPSRQVRLAEARQANREVIAIDQDKLGKQATRVAKNGELEVWALGLKGSRKVRDLWAHADRTRRKCGSHGVVLVKVAR